LGVKKYENSEIKLSKNDLQNVIGAPIKYFTYPNGCIEYDIKKENIQMVKSIGYERGCINPLGGVLASDPWQSARFTPWDKNSFGFTMRLLRNDRKLY